MNNLSAYDIDIVEASIINFEGKIYDISNLLGGFELEENLFTTFATASITLQNAIGLIEKLPIIGEEFVILSFESMSTKKRNQWIFMVDSISDRSESNENTETFTLQCRSTEYLTDRFVSVDGSYMGMKISEIAAKVYKDLLISKVTYPFGENFNFKKKKLKVDETDGLNSFIGNMESPITFIKRLLYNAKSLKYKESDYLFYETASGFKFRAISALQEEPVKEKFYYDVQTLNNTLDNREIKNYQIIQTYVFNSSVDVGNNVDMGMYDNEVCYIDLLTKTYKTKRFIYHKDVKKSLTTMGKNKLTSKNSIFSKQHAASPSSAFLISHDTDSYEIPYIKDRLENDPYLRWPTTVHDVYSYRISKAAQLVNTLSISIIIPGNTTIEAGDLIDIFIPEKTSTVADSHKYNHFLGSEKPTCLVTAVKHMFINSRYMTMLRCVKAGYDGKIKSRDI